MAGFFAWETLETDCKISSCKKILLFNTSDFRNTLSSYNQSATH